MATIDGGAALFADDLLEAEMGTRTMKETVCDRCGAVIQTEDDDAGQLCVNDMTDEWELIGSSRPLGYVCGVCVRSVRAWLLAGGAKPE